MHLPIAGPLMDYLMAIPSSDNPTAPLFQNAYDAAGKTTGTLSNRFHDILALAGLVIKRTHAKKYAAGVCPWGFRCHALFSVWRWPGRSGGRSLRGG